MIIMSALWQDNITSKARMIQGKVELYNGSTLADTFVANTKLSSIKIERTPTNGVYFGYTISQKATVKLIDKDGTVSISKGQNMKIYLGTNGEYATLPTFKISDFKRDEVKGTIEITAFDLIQTAAEHTLNELEIAFPATLLDYMSAIATLLETEVVEDFQTVWYYEPTFTEETQPNYEGTESLREVLEDIAQASGSVCFIDADNKIRFKFLENNPVAEIDKSQYFSLEISDPIRLSKISATTELGDNIHVGDDTGFNQIIHDNPFFEASIDEASAAISVMLNNYQNTSIYPYNIKWRGNPALEIGDCVSVEIKDGTKIPIIYLGETIQYTGGMSATSEWKSEEKKQVNSNPTTIGEAIKQTYAKVDKVNKQISMVVSESNATSESVAATNEVVAALQLSLDGINASVKNIEQITSEAIEGMSENISTLQTSVDATMSSEDIQLAIKSELSNGTDKITTSTGYTFNEEGLTVSKSDSEMETTITEDGMKVYKNDEEVLVANNIGVQAKNLEATTYLIIGKYSRFEDYINENDQPRTGCFWIGD
jgi:hypothetical protein